MPRIRVLLVASLVAGLASSPALAGFDPLTALLTVNQVQRGIRQVKGHWSRLQRKMRGANKRTPAPKMGPILEKMRSPFSEDRQAGAIEMLEVARRFADNPQRIPEIGRAEILLGQLMRDASWRIRYKAYETLVTLKLMEPVKDSAERYALIFPKRTPVRGATPVAHQAVGPSDMDLVHDFMAALKTGKPRVRTQLAGVLEKIMESGALTPPAGTLVDLPAGAAPVDPANVNPGLLPETGGFSVDGVEMGLF